MRKKTHAIRPPLTRLGAPEAGIVTSVAIGLAGSPTVFAGTPVGVFRCQMTAGQAPGAWERCPRAPTGVLSLAVSPAYAQDRALWAGARDGVYLSTDGGDSWSAAQMPIAGAAIIAFSCSPNFSQDRLLLAGTVEDGILYSNNGGQSWQNKSFGLLDATVLCLAFSPGFAQDATVFAGTDTSLYHSYNGALAWKALSVPDEALPALSLLVSAEGETGRTLYLGSEQHGLFQSTDQGASWQPLNLPASCVNALLQLPHDAALVAATEAGIFRSTDQGSTWQSWLAITDVIGLAAQPGLTVAGTADRGAWATGSLPEWQALSNLPARSVHGLTLSPRFDQDPLAFMFGQQEGIWRSPDGGRHWESLNDALPSPDTVALALSPLFANDRTLVAGSSDGVLISADAGSHWRAASDAPASLVAFSPDGSRLAANFPGHGVKVTLDLGQQWFDVPGPWDGAGDVIALALNNAGQIFAGHSDTVGQAINLWQGVPGQFERVLTHPAGENPVLRLYVPPEPAPHRPWYASLGNQVWTLSSRKGQAAALSEVFAAPAHQENIISLSGYQDQGAQTLLAATGQHIYQSAGGQAWIKVYDFGPHPVVAMALSPNFAQNRKAYVLLLGGVFAEAVIS